MDRSSPVTDGDEGAMLAQAVVRVAEMHGPVRSEVPYAWDPISDRGWDLTSAVAKYKATLPAWKLETLGGRVYAEPTAWEAICQIADVPPTAISMTIDIVYTSESAPRALGTGARAAPTRRPSLS